MKKVIVIILFAVNNLYAQNIITVDNATPSGGDYLTLQAAHDAAINGDSIYVYPSGVSYGAIIVTKQLNFFGTGFDAPGAELNTTNISGTMTFNSGSDGSALEGFGGNFLVAIDADNIAIKRNYIKRVDVNEDHIGTVILQNYVNDYRLEYLINVAANNNVFIANNFFINTYRGGYPSYPCGAGIDARLSSISITILHNVFNISGQAINVDNSNKYISNNIIKKGLCNGTSNGYYYNMCNENQLPSGNGNIPNVDMNTVFEGFYHLQPSSPAIGAGQNGVDMGIYGGSTPFVEGGRPSLPLIIQLDSDHLGSQAEGLDVTIKAKTNPE